MPSDIPGIGAIITYVIPAGENPTRRKFIEARGDGTQESVAAFFERCRIAAQSGCLLSIELIEIE